MTGKQLIYLLYSLSLTIILSYGCQTPSEEEEPMGGEVMAGDNAGETFAGEMPAGEMPAGEMPAGEMPAGEMPAGEMPAGEMPAGEMTAGEMTAGEMPAGEMPAGEIMNQCEEDSDCADEQVCIEAQCQEPPNLPDFCRFQSPLDSTIETNDELSVYARVFEQGITNATPQTDENELVLGQIGWRRSGNAQFEWLDAEANLDYNGLPFGREEAVRDEYQAVLTFETSGTFELAARFSVDGGLNWLLCDYGVDGAGSDDGFDQNELGSVLVLDPCDEGYIRAEDNSCADIDECATDNGGCDQNASCENQIGAAPLCTCNNGYDGDGQNCADVDECLTDNGGCDLNASCTNNIGEIPTCVCNGGYEGNGQTCSDINECAIDNGGCDLNASCTNNIGFEPTCTCNNGYDGNGQSCSDINECITNNGGCDPNAQCTNNAGAAPTCECKFGYTGDGQSCVDINECATDNGGCDVNASCTNNQGALPTCTCNFGYAGNGIDCADVNECLVANGGCSTNASCENNVGALPTCTCNEGYDGNGVDCNDVNECLTNNGGCDPLAICTNNEGSPRTCACPNGYDGDGETCTIILPTTVAELEEGDLMITEIQANPASVSDSNGEWFEIYSPSKNVNLDGLVIRDAVGTEVTIDSSSVVDGRSLVIEAREYVVFARNAEPTLNGGINADFAYSTLSLNNDGDSLILLANGEIIDAVTYAEATSGASYSFNGNLEPNANLNNDANNFCDASSGTTLGDKGTPGQANDPCPLCRPGYIETSDGECQDINECAVDNGGCADKATCQNNEGAPPTCTCNEGYEGDGQSCTDIDECAVNNGDCGDPVVYQCVNNEGIAPSCLCNAGFQEISAGSCVDIDECQTNNGGCDSNATCQNNFGSAPTCTCNDGFNGDGQNCTFPTNPVDYCRIQFPTNETVPLDDELTFFMRYYEQGITDQSPSIDESETLSVEFGVGPANSDPRIQGEDWVWSNALPNDSYDGNASGEPNNDEYLAEFAAEEVGNFDFAFRISIDLQQTWVYCDINGAGENEGTAPNYAYDFNQNGSLTVELP